MLALAQCGAITSNSKAVFVLADASGTYSTHMDEAVATSRVITSRLNPNDLIAFGQISSCSFTDESLVVRQKLPSTPSQAARTKQAVFEVLNDYALGIQATAYTDIKGGLRYAAGELEQSDSENRIIVIISDLVEDVSPQCDTSNLTLDLDGITVIATNVTKLNSEASDPDAYARRLEDWQRTVEEAGGTWIHANSRDRLLDTIF